MKRDFDSVKYRARIKRETLIDDNRFRRPVCDGSTLRTVRCSRSGQTRERMPSRQRGRICHFIFVLCLIQYSNEDCEDRKEIATISTVDEWRRCVEMKKMKKIMKIRKMSKDKRR